MIENSATHIRINTQWLEAEPRFMNILVAIPVCVCVCVGGNSNGKLATYNPTIKILMYKNIDWCCNDKAINGYGERVTEE